MGIASHNVGVHATNKVTEHGDILLGGLFPIHQKGRSLVVIVALTGFVFLTEKYIM